jgi:beta-glucanase (GH16 family)
VAIGAAEFERSGIVRSDNAKAGRVQGWLIFWCVLLIVALLIDPAMTDAKKRGNQSQPTPPQRVWKLAFQDDFDGSALNENLWATQFPWGRDRSTVGELQYYAPDAFKVANSKLQITAQPTQPGATHLYNSGLISTYKSFATQYGRFEIRCKIPRGKGLWPAFWLLPTDTSWPPEIDVFEALGDSTNTVHMTSHWSENGEHRSQGAEYSGPDFSDGFHTFATEWSDKSIVWYVDGVERLRVDNHSPQVPMYLVANMAVGGQWPGAPDASTAFPATFQIDYIRAYKSELAPSTTSGKDQNDKGKKNKNSNNDNKRKRNKRKGRLARRDMKTP